MANNFAPTLLHWFHEHGRDLPWRQTRDPYAIWLSEIILQQTQVRQGWAYWERFMKRWPKVELLAAATEDEVLREWQGLGYYSRARNLHTAARQIVDDSEIVTITTITTPVSMKNTTATRGTSVSETTTRAKEEGEAAGSTTTTTKTPVEMTTLQAAAVSSIGTANTSSTTVFTNNKKIVTFRELIYFAKLPKPAITIQPLKPIFPNIYFI